MCPGQARGGVESGAGPPSVPRTISHARIFVLSAVLGLRVMGLGACVGCDYRSGRG
jgi:hypothetical protein